ncbi:HAD hydrolase-like protein [Candidatus Pacearchaeota archaeon]|nr:HAD hydrolase-like protein [Candidatus Pacearchaeota archaeon]MBD3283036.1 HAD hydrolase-like protein [Candidatus Pacearchaeota archaeon]
MAKLVLWDFDGPIADSIRGYHALYDRICEQLGVEKQWEDLESFREWVSGNWRENISRLGLTERLGETEPLHNDYLQEMPEIQSSVANTLATIFMKGYNNAVLSGQSESYLNRVLKDKGLLGFFHRVLGCDSLSTEKFNPETLREARELFDAGPDETVYIADTVQDIEFAHQDCSRVIAVTYGWHPEAKLQAYRPDELVGSSLEIPSKLDELFTKVH